MKKVLLGLLVCGMLATPALAQDRVSASEKGSLLIWSKVELVWNSAGNLLQDTFIGLTNDYPGSVNIQLYFINGDEPLDWDGAERAHPGWNSVDVGFELTANQPTYWSVATGLPQGTSPFTILDPGFPPGRPDPTGTGNRVLRGYVIGWAVNANGAEIRWNHLSGQGLLVNYQTGSAWEYNAWTFAVVSGVAHGAESDGIPGQLALNGVEYEPAYSELLFDFYAVNSPAFSGPRIVTVDTDLTMFPVPVDLRQETDGPVTTKAMFTVWNMNETKFSEFDRCITCWDQQLLSNYGIPNHFLLQNLQTNKGKARIDGVASQVCNFDYDLGDGLPLGADPRDIVSQAAPLLGVAAKLLNFDSGMDYGMAGSNLFGMGTETALIQYDVITSPPDEAPVKKPGRINNTRPALQIDSAVPVLE